MVKMAQYSKRKKVTLEEQLKGLQIQILNVDYKEDQRGWEHYNVISPFSRLILVTDGKITIEHHDRTYILKPHSLHLVPCLTETTMQCSEGTSYYFAHFIAPLTRGGNLCSEFEFDYQVQSDTASESLFKNLVALLPSMGLKECQPHSLEEKRSILRRLSRLGTGLCAEKSFAADGIIRQLLLPFLSTIQQPQSQPSPEEEQTGTISEALVYIDRNLNRSYSMQELSQAVKMSPHTFTSQFHKVFGARPKEFIAYRKVEKALGLMANGSFSLKEISHITGFSDAGHFSRTFKKVTGVSPSQYLQTVSA